MTQLTQAGLVKILGQVTAIMVIPIFGGSVGGLILDRILGTSPLLVALGLAGGTAIAGIGIWLMIRSGVRKGYTRGPGDGG